MAYGINSFYFVRDDFSFSHRKIIKKSNTLQYFFDLSFKWALIFSVIGITGVIMTFLPDKK